MSQVREFERLAAGESFGDEAWWLILGCLEAGEGDRVYDALCRATFLVVRAGRDRDDVFALARLLRRAMAKSFGDEALVHRFAVLLDVLEIAAHALDVAKPETILQRDGVAPLLRRLEEAGDTGLSREEASAVLDRKPHAERHILSMLESAGLAVRGTDLRLSLPASVRARRTNEPG